MEKRVIGYPTAFSNIAYHSMILQLIRENLSAPTVVTTDYPADPFTRKISPVQVQSSVVNVSYGSAMYHGENLLTVVDQLLQLKGYGLRSYLSQGEIIFDIYEGRDRTWVTISPRTDMILSSEYEYSIRGQCNTAFVYAKGDEEHTQADGSNAYTVTSQYPSNQKWGYARYEGFMAGTADTLAAVTESVTQWVQGRLASGEPVASNYAVYCPDYIQSGKKVSVTWALTSDTAHSWGYVQFYDARSEYITSMNIANGDTITPPTSATNFRISLRRSIESTLAPADVSSASYTVLRDRTLAEYKAAVAEQGAALMTAPSEKFAAEVSETGLYQIGTHYTLGDTVTLENSYGISGTAKVSEITESISADGRHIYPTFTDWTPTTQQEG